MWLRHLAELSRGIGELLFPNTCLICATPETDRSRFRHGLCNDCHLAVSVDPKPACVRCAATVGPHVDTRDGCPVCRAVSFGFDAAMRLGPHDGRLREAVLRMKTSAGEGLADMLGRVSAEVLGTRIRSAGVEVVVPVPLHWRRRWTRGYNQAAAAARNMGANLGIAFDHALTRVRNTPPQVGSTAAARRENVRGAFRCRSASRFAGRVVLLVDDVMTTGSTVSEAARTLRAAGATRVIVAVLARR